MTMMMRVLKDGKEKGFTEVSECFKYGITHIGDYCSYSERIDCEIELEKEFKALGGFEEADELSIDEATELLADANDSYRKKDIDNENKQTEIGNQGVGMSWSVKKKLVDSKICCEHATDSELN